ncbi:hypothetical protein PR048_019132 [Dryococelus australis]|uniref:Uncharacterized protein n=1 Tax=Dryococelus australis TaxID=614101 RepID=A0ABQ9H2N5_9NEOP|nr:hypothetical protein PR048_019132 [Dryococelus australis]
MPLLKVPRVHAALRQHCTPVQSPAHSGDGALVARAIVTLIAAALLCREEGEKHETGVRGHAQRPGARLISFKLSGVYKCVSIGSPPGGGGVVAEGKQGEGVRLAWQSTTPENCSRRRGQSDSQLIPRAFATRALGFLRVLPYRQDEMRIRMLAFDHDVHSVAIYNIANFLSPVTVTRSGIEPGSPWWEASAIIAQPPWPHLDLRILLRTVVSDIYMHARIQSEVRDYNVTSFTGSRWMPLTKYQTASPHRVKIRVVQQCTEGPFKIQFCMKQNMGDHRNAKAGKTGDPRGNPPISGFARYNSQVGKSATDPAGNLTWFSLTGCELASRCATMVPMELQSIARSCDIKAGKYAQESTPRKPTNQSTYRHTVCVPIEKLEVTMNGLQVCRYGLTSRLHQRHRGLSKLLTAGGTGIESAITRDLRNPRHLSGYYAMVRRQQCSPIGLARPELRPQPYRTSLERIGSPVRACQAQPKSIAQLVEWLQEEWRRIPVDVLQTLVEDMPDRVAAVIGTAPECKGGGKRQILEKTRRPAATSGIVHSRLHEAEEYPGSRTLAGLQKRPKIPGINYTTSTHVKPGSDHSGNRTRFAYAASEQSDHWTSETPRNTVEKISGRKILGTRRVRCRKEGYPQVVVARVASTRVEVASADLTLSRAQGQKGVCHPRYTIGGGGGRVASHSITPANICTALPSNYSGHGRNHCRCPSVNTGDSGKYTCKEHLAPPTPFYGTFTRPTNHSIAHPLYGNLTQDLPHPRPAAHQPTVPRKVGGMRQGVLVTMVECRYRRFMSMLTRYFSIILTRSASNQPSHPTNHDIALVVVAPGGQMQFMGDTQWINLYGYTHLTYETVWSGPTVDRRIEPGGIHGRIWDPTAHAARDLDHPRGAAAMWQLDFSPPTYTNRVSIPSGVALGFSHVGIVPNEAAGRRSFLGDLPFSPPF